MKNKAQATLEFTVTFVIMILLLFGLLAIWKKWADKIIERQYNYGKNRVENGNWDGNWDVGTGAPIPWMAIEPYLPDKDNSEVVPEPDFDIDEIPVEPTPGEQ